MHLYDRIADPSCLVRRMYVVAAHTQNTEAAKKTAGEEQLDLFTDYEAFEKQKEQEEKDLAKEGQLQQTLLAIKSRFGKNAVMPGTSYQEEATGRDRNAQIGGHRK